MEVLLVLVLVFVAVAVAVTVFFAARHLLLLRAIKNVNEELKEVARHLDQNRIVKLPYPNKDLEALLEAINATLDETRHKALEFSAREADLKAQIEHISHDLRTPLTAILGYLSFIDTEELGAENRESLETVTRKAHALQRLIAQFHELSLANTGEHGEEREHVDAARMAREAVMSQYRLLQEQGLEVLLEIPDNPVMVWANTDALERIYANLLQNAGRYAKSYLAVSLEQGEGMVTFRFANDVENATVLRQPEHLFLPFYTADSARSQEGSGLGLTIARRFAEQQGGSLTAETTRENTDESKTHAISFILKVPTS